MGEYNETPELTDELETLKAKIEGKKVVSVSVDKEKLTLDDGTVLHLYMSDSNCCASAYGDWVIEPDALEAIITDVKFEVVGDRVSDGDGAESTAKITILHNQNPVALADCYANDGNGGYYFSQLTLAIEVPDDEPVRLDVISA